ncbi:MAG TPA: cytochrome c3 family protein [Pirellulales bacterium]|jgi:NAD-dependent SIR2 family protein deacetylase|nr:cytochrome c3 family protein [Pirellulales bacterium]
MQIFPRSFNTISKASIFGGLFILAGLWWALEIVYHSSYVTAAETPRLQPVPFSHAHHVGQLHIDCRYCHTSVENSSFAGIPPTKTCMNCHSQIWVGSEMLGAVRESYKTNQSIPWDRVHSLPQFVYFDHSIHIAKGVGCVTCHGQIDQMPLTMQTQSLLMSWCVDCHREPERHVRPREEVFNMNWSPDRDQLELGRELVKQYHIQSLTSCSTCHR